MECKYAYMKQHIDYVLCKKEPEPDRHDRRKLFHAMCGHQVNCPKENCHKLTSSWRNCAKLVEREPVKTEETYEDVFPGAGDDPEMVAPKRGRKKASE